MPKVRKNLVKAPRWNGLCRWYIVASEDQAINPELERFYAKRIGATTTEIKSSHALCAAPERSCQGHRSGCNSVICPRNSVDLDAQISRSRHRRCRPERTDVRAVSRGVRIAEKVLAGEDVARLPVWPNTQPASAEAEAQARRSLDRYSKRAADVDAWLKAREAKK